MAWIHHIQQLDTHLNIGSPLCLFIVFQLSSKEDDEAKNVNVADDDKATNVNVAVKQVASADTILVRTNLVQV